MQFGFHTTGDEVVDYFKNEAKGKTIVITGTSEGGLGAETAITLAKTHPAHLVLLARSSAKVEPVQAKTKEINPAIKTTFVSIELDDFDSVRAAASKVNTLVEKIDILINNAGIMAVPKYETTKYGIEKQFATNHLGHFLLTSLIFNKIQAAGPEARIVNLSSCGYKISPCRLDDYNFQDGKEYDAWSSYGQAKTANILFTRELAKKGVTAFAIHPGTIMSTSLGSHVDMELFQTVGPVAKKNTGKDFEIDAPKTIQEGVATTLRAVLDPSLKSVLGAYLANSVPEEVFDYAASSQNAEKLWQLSEKLVGQEFSL